MAKTKKLPKTKWKYFPAKCLLCGEETQILYKHEEYVEDEHGDLQLVLNLPPAEDVWTFCAGCKKITLFVP